jgi:hypothetical protein
MVAHSRSIFIIAILLGLLTACQPAANTPVDQVAPSDSQATVAPTSKPKVCSFNIQFLGNSKIRDNKALANTVKNAGCTLVLIQEAVAPPDLRLLAGNTFPKKGNSLYLPDGKREMRPQPIVTDFFKEMQKAGFDKFWLSEEDTGPVEDNNNNGSATEWWVAFYMSEIWQADPSLPHGFLDNDLTNNKTWDRVPYAFSFKSYDSTFDFVIVSVHLRPGAEPANKKRRGQEIKGIKAWIEEQKSQTLERDFVIAGDCNLEDQAELKKNESPQFRSLNTDAAWKTNTNLAAPKPYDHVFVDPADSQEISILNNFEVIDLKGAVRFSWEHAAVDFPGGPNYNHNLFRFYYSDHMPVSFVVDLPNQDDD